MCLKKIRTSIKEDIGFVRSFIYTLDSVRPISEMPYCDLIGRRMVCLFCPKHIVEKKENTITSYCEIAYTKRLKND